MPVQLHLMPRTKLERVVQVMDTDQLMNAFDQPIADGSLYGDCQFSTDVNSDDFLQKGGFSCYRPLLPDAPMARRGQGTWGSAVAQALLHGPCRYPPRLQDLCGVLSLD